MAAIDQNLLLCCQEFALACDPSLLPCLAALEGPLFPLRTDCASPALMLLCCLPCSAREHAQHKRPGRNGVAPSAQRLRVSAPPSALDPLRLDPLNNVHGAPHGPAACPADMHRQVPVGMTSEQMRTRCFAVASGLDLPTLGSPALLAGVSCPENSCEAGHSTQLVS